MQDKNVNEIPLSIIESAIQGEDASLRYVLSYFKNYINKLATRVMTNEYGEKYYYVDDDIVARLEAKLVFSIINNFKIER